LLSLQEAAFGAFLQHPLDQRYEVGRRIAALVLAGPEVAAAAPGDAGGDHGRPGRAEVPHVQAPRQPGGIDDRLHAKGGSPGA
jgi:hypothetical protein